MKFPINSWEKMSPDEQNLIRNMSEEELLARWDTDQGREIKRKIIEINLSYGSSKDYKSFLGTVKTSWGKGRTKNNLAFLHPVFTTSLIDPPSQNPQHNTAMPAVLLNQID